MTERSTVINSLYKDIYNQEKVITHAPPKEMLKKYGGPYTIDKFREISNSEINVYYQSVLPPLLSMKYQIEEFYGKLYNNNQKDMDINSINNDSHSNNSTKNIVCENFLNNERVNKAQERYVNSSKVKKIYNYPTNNTIENRMGIVLNK